MLDIRKSTKFVRTFSIFKVNSMYPVSMQGVYKYSRRIRFSEMRAAAETC